MQNKFFRMIDRVPTLIVFATAQSLLGLVWFIGALVWHIATNDLSWIQYFLCVGGLVGLSGLLAFIVWVLWEEWQRA